MTASKSIALSLLLGLSLAANHSSAMGSNYCAAIRGNGELMPAHWGAMADVVEKKGLPKMMAGGSSASISIFLFESVALNKLADTADKQALLIKSFQGYVEALSLTEDGQSLKALLAKAPELKALGEKAQELGKIISDSSEDSLKEKAAFKMALAKNLKEIQDLSFTPEFKALLNPEFIQYVQITLALAQSPRAQDVAVANYRATQIHTAITKFGSFDAVNDKTLLVRPGLIDFAALAQQVGTMANFYANYNSNTTQAQQRLGMLNQFLTNCAPLSKGRTWNEISAVAPQCQKLLIGTVLGYLNEPLGSESRLEENVGAHVNALVSTSVIQGKSAQKFADYFSKYQRNAKADFEDFQILTPQDLKFGYWGLDQTLDQVERGLRKDPDFKRDPKSEKFLSLGVADWASVLALSPAEPGLSRVQAINNHQLSAGGWSDLHPMAVLKQAGCEEIVYLTRKGGESKFAQAVYRRLTGASELEMNDLYGQNNPRSSMLLSQSYATEIKCTNWNEFDVKSQFMDLIAEAYAAPMITEKQCF